MSFWICANDDDDDDDNDDDDESDLDKFVYFGIDANGW